MQHVVRAVGHDDASVREDGPPEHRRERLGHVQVDSQIARLERDRVGGRRLVAPDRVRRRTVRREADEGRARVTVLALGRGHERAAGLVVVPGGEADR